MFPEKTNRKMLRLLLLLLIAVSSAQAQMTILDGLITTDRPPENLLATRSVVIYETSFSDAELNEVQKWFQQTGIDAVAYFDYEYIFSGPDFVKFFSDYCTSRLIPYLVFVQKNGQYEFTIVKTSGKKDLIDRELPAWKVKAKELMPALREIYQTALGSQKKQNFLINDLPEREVIDDVAVFR